MYKLQFFRLTIPTATIKRTSQDRAAIIKFKTLKNNQYKYFLI